MQLARPVMAESGPMAETGGDEIDQNETAEVTAVSFRDYLGTKGIRQGVVTFLALLSVVVVVTLWLVPLMRSYKLNADEAERWALRTTWLAGISAEVLYVGSLPTNWYFDNADGFVSGDPEVIISKGNRSDQVVASQTMSSLYSSRASDDAAWLILVISVALLSLLGGLNSAIKQIRDASLPLRERARLHQRSVQHQYEAERAARKAARRARKESRAAWNKRAERLLDDEAIT